MPVQPSDRLPMYGVNMLRSISMRNHTSDPHSPRSRSSSWYASTITAIVVGSNFEFFSRSIPVATDYRLASKHVNSKYLTGSVQLVPESEPQTRCYDSETFMHVRHSSDTRRLTISARYSHASASPLIRCVILASSLESLQCHLLVK